MNSQLELKVLNLLRALAAMYKPSLLESSTSLDMYLDQLDGAELTDIEEAVRDWNSMNRTMPLPSDLKEIATKKRAEKFQTKFLSNDSVCPTCRNTTWAICYTDRGSTAVQKCFSKGIHTLDPETLEQRNRNNLARGIHRLLNGRTENLGEYLHKNYSANSLLEISSEILVKLYRNLNAQLIAT